MLKKPAVLKSNRCSRCQTRYTRAYRYFVTLSKYTFACILILQIHFNNMRVIDFALLLLLFITLIPLIYAGAFKDVFSKKGKERQEDPHEECMPKNEFTITKRERDNCRSRLTEVMTVNYELEMERDDLKIAIERLQSENTRRILRMENSLRELENHREVVHHPSVPPTPFVPQGYTPRPPPLQMYPRQVFPPHAQVTTVPLQQPQMPNVISSQSPGFQRALRANKSYNDMRRRQQAERDPDNRPPF